MCGDPGFDHDFLDAMLGDFLDESQEYLARLNENLLALDELTRGLSEDESVDVDAELLNTMFRDAHSLKGLSAMLQLHDINRLTHRMENVFDAARHGNLAVRRPVIDLMFEALDYLTRMVDRLKTEEEAPVSYEPVVEAIGTLLSGGEAAHGTGETGADADGEAIGSEGTKDAVSSPAPAASVPVPVEDPFQDLQDDDDVPEKYLSIFIDEAEESVGTLYELLESRDAAASKDIMVVCHRIKGAAASVGLHRCAKLAHRMEDLLQSLHGEGRGLTGEVMDALLAGVDALRHFIESLKQGAPDIGPFPAAYALLTEVERHGQVASPAPSSTSRAAPAETESSDAADAAGAGTLTEQERSRLADALKGSRPWVAGVVQFDASVALPGLKALAVCERLRSLGSKLVTLPPEAELEQSESLERFVFGLVTKMPAADVGKKATVSGVAAVHVMSGTSSENAAESKLKEQPDRPAADTAKPESQGSAPSSAKPQSDSRPAEKRARRPAETVRVDIERLDHLMNLTGELVISKARLAQLCDQLKGITTHKQSMQIVSSLVGRLERVEKRVATCPEGNGGWDVDLRTLIEDIRRVGDCLQEIARARGTVGELEEAVHQLDRVSDGLQKTVMDTRMVPIGPLFQRFKRVVRDLSRGNGKEIRLVLSGEKTELDKRMIDELGDPLIHMVRNAADHGIETAGERCARNKPPYGTVWLNAYHRGNQIFVEVRDDGRGLDPDKLKAKAIEKGILSAADAERMSDAQAFRLIWEPGFSTAAQVTEISGRGMGMDIVRSKVEALNGSIDVESRRGEGTTITVKLPLTMAILHSLLALIDEEVYAIPIEAVIEIVRVRRQDVTTVRGFRTVRLRDRVLPIAELRSIFRWNRNRDAIEGEEQDERTMIVVGTPDNALALVVDDILGEQDIVIKSLAENYRNVDGLAGASILGNGRVALILDVGAILAMASRGTADPERLPAKPEADVPQDRPAEPQLSA